MKIGDVIRRFGRCFSTLDEARRLAVAGEAEGTVVVAETQTGGRGTRGRSWFSPPGKGLYMTAILRPRTASFSLLPLAAGLAAREAASAGAGREFQLKWPNDVVCEGRKLGGILCESGRSSDGGRFVVAGIGLNVNNDPNDFPVELRAAATSLKIAAGRAVDRDALLERLCISFETWYNIFNYGTGNDIVRAFQEWMTFSPGEKIRLDTGGAVIEGIFIKLDSSGGLVCEDNGRRRTHFSAEVHSLDLDRTRS